MAFFIAIKSIIVYNMQSTRGCSMKKMHYYFDMSKEAYDFIIKKGLLKESRLEKTILDLCLQGESIKGIMIKTGYSSRTINYRKKDIYNKVNKYFF